MGRIRVHPIGGGEGKIVTGQFTCRNGKFVSLELGFMPQLVIVYAKENDYASGGNSGNYSADTYAVPKIMTRDDYSAGGTSQSQITQTGFRYTFYRWNADDGTVERTLYYVAFP